MQTIERHESVRAFPGCRLAAGLIAMLGGSLQADLSDVTQPGDPIVATSSNSPGSEGVANAIDNQPTKYLNFDKLNTGFVVTPNKGPTIVMGMMLTSANDHPERDPASYTLEGSNDGTNFTAISSGSVPPFPTRFFTNQILFPEQTNSFRSYRLIFPTVVDPTAANSMQIAEVELLGQSNTNPVPCSASSPLIREQPMDTPVLLGSRATFGVRLTGPWRVQWQRDGVEISGANSATYTTPPATPGDDGARYRVRVANSSCYQESDEVVLHIFTPSPTESIALNWLGHGSGGGPTLMFPDDITGLHPQAYWNNVTGASGSLKQPLNSSNRPHATITVQWDTSGQWGVGTGVEDAAHRLFDGMCTSVGTNEETAQSITFSNVPPGDHSLLLYAVQMPWEFFAMDFHAITFNEDGTAAAVQRRFIRPQNGDEYLAAPGFVLVTSDSASTRGVGNTLRFDHLQPGDGRIQIRFFSPDRIPLPPPPETIRGPGLNGLQLLLNPNGVRPRIGSVSYSRSSASVSFATIRGLIYAVEYTDALTEPWTTLLPFITGTGSPVTVVDSSPDPDLRLYRVQVR